MTYKQGEFEAILNHVNGLTTQMDIYPGHDQHETKVRTSERNNYRRCRRKWWLQSENHMNLEPITSAVHFWLGTGFHYAMEQHYGHKKMTAEEALEAYHTHTKSSFPAEKQADLWDAYILCRGMIKNFLVWHDTMLGNFQTAVDSGGNPLVEVNLKIPMGFKDANGNEVLYSATIDRIVRDQSGGIWIVDYKTAKKFNTDKLAKDPQITAYYWALKKLYNINIQGMIYIQVLKALPDSPEMLKSKKLSKSKSQNTTYALYMEAIEKNGLDVGDYTDFLQHLRGEDLGHETRYFRVDFVERNAHQLAAEEIHLVAETREMVTPGLAIYPNPTRDCMWECDFRAVCEAMDDGSDWRHMIALTSRPRQDRESSWREKIKKSLEQKKMTKEEATAIGADWLR